MEEVDVFSSGGRCQQATLECLESSEGKAHDDGNGARFGSVRATTGTGPTLTASRGNKRNGRFTGFLSNSPAKFGRNLSPTNGKLHDFNRSKRAPPLASGTHVPPLFGNQLTPTGGKTSPRKSRTRSPVPTAAPTLAGFSGSSASQDSNPESPPRSSPPLWANRPSLC